MAPWLRLTSTTYRSFSSLAGGLGSVISEPPSTICAGNATVSATMNTAGQVGAVIRPVLVVHLKDDPSYGWNADLVLMGASFFAASLFWFLIDPQKKV